MATNNAINLQAAGVVSYNGAGVFSGSTFNQYYALVGGASNAVVGVAPSATSGVPLISQGAASNPAFGTAVVAGGGTGAVTLTGVLTGNGTSAVTANAITQYYTLVAGASSAVSNVAPGTSGQVLTSNGASANPSYQTFTPSAMSPFLNVTGTTQTMAVNTGYVSNNAGLVTFTPPATCAVGTVFAIAGSGAGGWTINLTTNSQTINYGSVVATTAVASSLQYDCVWMVCNTANTAFTVLNSQGNLSYS